jgi:hypothetical protein
MEYFNHWEWVNETVIDFGTDIQVTAQEMDITFMEALALYDFVLKLDHFNETGDLLKIIAFKEK